MPDSLFAKATTLEALTAAWERVFANQGAPGADGMSVARFATDAPARLASLHWSLVHHRYTPGPLRRIAVPKAHAPGTRTLSIPCVVDRVAQTAVTESLTDVLEPEFEDSSFAYRRGRSVQQAVARVAHLHANGYPWVVDGDIRAFFDEVPHAPLLARLGRSVDDAAVVDLVERWLDGFGESGRGLAQGSPISPLLANLYLDDLDEAFEGGPVRIVRFADDFVLLTKSHKSAEAALARARDVLAAHGLALNPDKTRIVPFEGAFTYLGHLFVRSVVLKQSGAARSAAEPPARAPAPFALGPRSLRDPTTAPDPTLDADEASARQVLGPPVVTDMPLVPSKSDLVSPRRRRRAPAPVDDPLADLAGDRDPADFALGLAPLYVMREDARLATANDCFTVFTAGAEKLRLPAAMVGRIDLGPDAGASDEALRLAAAHSIPVAFVNGLGAAQATLLPAAADHGGLHLAQARLCLDPARALAHARALVEAKLRNSHALLKRLNARRKREDVAKTAAVIRHMWRHAAFARDIAQARGFEGAGGRLHWRGIGACLDQGFTLPRRRADPHNPVAAALNFTASLLMRDVTAAVLRAGLHPGFGVLHAVADDRDACAFDLIEAFRAPLSEGLTVYLFNNRILRRDDFAPGEAAVRLTGAASRRLVETYEAWVARPVKDPRTGAFATWRGLLLSDARALARSLREGAPFAPYRMDY